MRVLLVSNGLPPRGQWGTERYTRQLATGLARRGHRVAVLAPRLDGGGPPHALEQIDAEGVELHLVSNPPDPRKRFASSYAEPGIERAFQHLLSEWRPDVVHFLYLMWHLSARLPVVCREAGVPALMTATDHGLVCHRGQMHDWRLRSCGGPHPAAVCARCIREPSPYDARPLHVLAKRWAVRAAHALGGLGRVVREQDVARREQVVRESLDALDHLVAPTGALEAVLLRAGVSPAKLSRLVYAFDQGPFLAARAQPPDDVVRIGYLGQFAPHKGLGTLVEAVELLRRSRPHAERAWEVLFYGEGGAGRHRAYPGAVFRGALGGEGRDRRVLVCPPFPEFDLPGVLAALHCVVVPSVWSENAPLAALEARAAGVWIVGSDVPGLREVVEPGVHGDLLPPGDARALADRLGGLILEPPRRSTAPGLPMSHHDHLGRVEALYGSLTGARRRAAGVAV